VTGLLARLFDWLRSREAAFFAAPKDPAPMTPEQALARLFEILDSYVGVGAHSAKPRFVSIFVPPFDVSSGEIFATPDYPQTANSTCGVTQIAALYHLLDDLGLLDLCPELHAPLGLDWWARASRLARRFNALRSPKDGAPGVGCIVHVALLVLGVYHQHWYMLRRALGGEGLFESIDGGAVEKDDKGRQFQAIARATRQLRPGFDVTAQKPIVEWIDVPALLAGLLALRAAPSSSSASTAKAPAIVSGSVPPSVLQLVDVSSSNAIPDYARIKASGVIGVIIRGTLGVHDQDTMVRAHVAAARAAGLLVGLYHLVFPRHNRAQDALEQAEDLVALHHELLCELRPWLDCEPEPGEAALATPTERRAMVENIATCVETLLGKPPIVYTFAGFAAAFGGSMTLARCPLVLADYGASEHAPIVAPHPVAPWAELAGHQHSGGKVQPPAIQGRIGRVDGALAPMDRSNWFAGIETLRA
jgi:GH25 family lysozyme M1 (1,4-beta-N-acetylmuramidase)